MTMFGDSYLGARPSWPPSVETRIVELEAENKRLRAEIARLLNLRCKECGRQGAA